MNIGSSYYTSSLTRQFAKLQDAQAQAQGMLATGRKFIEASDNPNAALEAQRISLSRLDLAGDADRRNLASRVSEAALLHSQQADDFLQTAEAQIAEARGSELDGTEIAQMKGSVDSTLLTVVGLLNYELDGRYLFGGDATFGPAPGHEHEAPFEIVDEDGDGSFDVVHYRGSDQNMEFDVGLDVRMDPTADAALNQSWADWMTNILSAKKHLIEGDVTASKAALDAAEVDAQSAKTTTFDLIGKTLRIQTIDEWAAKADANLANREASLQEADVNEVVLKFNELQRNYQASLQSGRMLLSLSLIDFI